MSVRPVCAKIDQDGIRNIVSINHLTRVGNKRKSYVSVTSDSRKNADTNLVEQSVS